MKRILIVEDNKTLAKLISTKIKINLSFDVDVAYTLKEAKLFLKMYKYFTVLTDLNLPDAPNGEIVDYVLNKGNKVIVLTANVNKDSKNKMLKKNIIDYINKSDMNNVDFIINTIKRLQKNQKHKILVAHAAIKARAELKERLENLFFKVITVAHGEEALNFLDLTPDISLVLTDYKMPVVDGLKLTKEIRKKYDKNSLKIIAISSDSDESINALFIKNGVNDYVNKDFSKEEFSIRINNSIEALENIEKLTNQANRDSLTGLYNRRNFMQNKEKLIFDMQNTNESYAVCIVSVDSFDKLSKENKDIVLITLSDILRTNTSYKDLVIRFDENEFYLIIRDCNIYNATEILNKIFMEVNHCVINIDDDNILKFSISIGLAIHQDDELDDTINNADMMLHNAQKNGGNQLQYD